MSLFILLFPSIHSRAIFGCLLRALLRCWLVTGVKVNFDFSPQNLAFKKRIKMSNFSHLISDDITSYICLFVGGTIEMSVGDWREGEFRP